MSLITIGDARRDPAPWRALGAVAATGAFLSFTNPFGATSGLPWWGSFLYWSLLVGEGWFGGPLMGAALQRLAPCLSALVVRALVTPFIAVVVMATILAVQRLLGEPVPLSYWPTLYVLVLGVSMGVAALGWVVERAFANQPGAMTHAPTGAAVSVRFLERLPAKLRDATLYAISAEDHYLRLHTSKGADLILMRLSDAIAELEGIEGAQTHRSWWVARDAVQSARREGVRLTLLLKGGVEAPVSRPNIRPLREAGWYE
ncbi:MAG: LytTR family DNA-binding domain-containing protein [Hyphomonadaceae bacterium]